MKNVKRIALGLLVVGLNSPLLARVEMVLKSDAFKNEEKIPTTYTCDGDDISPPLRWSGAPDNTVSYALICDDPDAPTKKPWVHWVIFNIPASMSELSVGVVPTKKPMKTIKQGKTSWKDDAKKQIGYHGPCPPSGTHRYFFKIYALDTILNLGAGVPREKLERAMKGHILAIGELMGTYTRLEMAVQSGGDS